MEQITNKACTVFIARVPDCEKAVLSQKNGLRTTYAERLLKYAYLQRFGLDADGQNLHKTDSGKWVCDFGSVSVSHSGKFVAVALCENAVGIDLQAKTAANEQTLTSIAKKFFNADELELFESSKNKTDAFFFIWCKKEALWKKLTVQPLTIKDADTTSESFCIKKLTLEKDVYYLAVTESDTEITFVEEKN